tara:strand:- start:195 stop:527 length:333 start_codon:yes stop_codon:yes gene_type:complete
MKDDTTFFKRVYKVVRLIPSGRVSTYGLIAAYLGTSKSARVVGYAMNASHKIYDIPAHRVVNRIGLLTGKHHFSGTNLMKELLESEGIVIKKNLITNFQNIIWDPSIELH